jgi:predicted membrane chloride channel (bestrophin family)
MEGRKYWSQIQLVSQNLARTIWIHADEREGDLGKEDLLGKLYVYIGWWRVALTDLNL